MASFTLNVSWVICFLLGSILAGQGPACVPICKNGPCPVKLTPIDLEECACRRMYHPNNKAEKHLTIKHKNSYVTITFPRKFTPGNESLLLLPGEDANKTFCYDIAKKFSGKIKSRVRVRCSSIPGVRYNDSTVLDKQYKYTGAHHGKIKVPGINKEGCDCYAPSVVKLREEGNSLIVDWQPFYGHQDIRVRVEEFSSRRSQNDTNVPNYRLCRSRMQNITFTHYKPGTYVAMVNAVGCKCQTHSDPLTIPRIVDSRQYVPESELQPATDQTPTKETVNMTIVLGVVGALAFLSVFSLGLTLMINRWRNDYQAVHLNNDMELQEQAFNNQLQTSDHQLEDQAPDNHTDNLQHQAIEAIFLNLRNLLGDIDIDITTDSHPAPEGSDKLELRITLNDVSILARQENNLPSKRLEMAIDHSVRMDEFELPLVVYVPDCISNPPNGTSNRFEGSDAKLSLRETIQRLSDDFDFESDEFGELIKSVNTYFKELKDDIKKIFLISDNGHEYHVKACTAFARLLEGLGKTVKYALDDSRELRTELRSRAPTTWTSQQLEDTDLVIVVASECLKTLLSAYQDRRVCRELNDCMGDWAPCALTQLAPRQHRPLIAYVSLGYDSQFIDDIERDSGLKSNMKYDLTKNPSEEGDGQLSTLAKFLSKLSSDHHLVQRTDEQSAYFYECVSAMKVFMTENRNWLRTKCPSLFNVENEETNMSETNISETNMSETNMSETNMSETNMSETNMSETNMSETIIYERSRSCTSLSITDEEMCDVLCRRTNEAE